MLHVFIDTSVLLRFYSYSDDTLLEVEKLSALVKARKISLLVTEQIIDERARNRDRELTESFKRLDQFNVSVQMPRYAEHHEAAGKLLIAMKEAKQAKGDLIAAIKSEIQLQELRADRIIQEMFDASKVLIRSPEILEKARLRRELGNPPGKKDSLGDQINWELILDAVPNLTDLHIVSKDNDYRGGISDVVANFFLVSEWKTRKRAKLYLYSGLSEFVKKHFPEIKVPSDAIKPSALKSLITSGSYAQTHASVAQLSPILDSISEQEALSVLLALTENAQISDIITDHDIKTFYKGLYSKFLLFTSFELDEALEEISEETFGVPF